MSKGENDTSINVGFLKRFLSYYSVNIYVTVICLTSLEIFIYREKKKKNSKEKE